MFLVTGITGKVGGASAEALLQAGKRVRAYVRDEAKAAEWKSRGVELVKGDWEDSEALAKALEDVEGAYLMVPPIPNPSREFREAKSIIASYQKALKQTPVQKIVALSSIGSEKTSGLGLITATHLLEQGLQSAAPSLAFVRAGSFYENYVFGLQAAQGGTLPVFYAPSDLAVPMIATKDIGAEVAKLLTSKWSGKRIIELGTAITADEMARQLGEVIGKDVKAQSLTGDALQGALEHMGLAPADTWGYREMVESVNSGWIAFGVAGTEPVASTTSAKDVFAQAAAK